MSAATEYCDREIADYQAMLNEYPNEAFALNRIINGWKRAKKQIQARIEQDAKENQ
ncbi:hypothetical protein ABIS04_16395 [Shewanella sp. H8]|uniref:hypothetical protein n=1 Tax=Shewanella sp. H8 TaxID=3342676 RepID=UPI0033152220